MGLKLFLLVLQNTLTEPQDTKNGFSGSKIPAHYVAALRSIGREKPNRKRQLDQLLGGLTGGAGGAAGGAGKSTSDFAFTWIII